jgi:hypothetical protein
MRAAVAIIVVVAGTPRGRDGLVVVLHQNVVEQHLVVGRVHDARKHLLHHKVDDGVVLVAPVTCLLHRNHRRDVPAALLTCTASVCCQKHSAKRADEDEVEVRMYTYSSGTWCRIGWPR